MGEPELCRGQTNIAIINTANIIHNKSIFIIITMPFRKQQTHTKTDVKQKYIMLYTFLSKASW